MATPIGWDTREPLSGAGDPLGREDTANKYLRGYYTNFRAGHASSGAHESDATIFDVPFEEIETGTYSGTGATNTVNLTNTDLQIHRIEIEGDLTQAPTIWAIPEDAISSPYVLQLNSDTTNGSQIFTDESPYNHVIYIPSQGDPSGVYHSTAQKHTGNSSIFFDGFSAGVGDWHYNLLQIDHPSAFAFNGDFTLDCWAYWTSTAAGTIFSTGDYDELGAFMLFSGSIVVFQYYNGSGFSSISSNPITINTWTHIEVIRDAGTITLYIDGISEGTPLSYITAFDSTRGFNIGGSFGSSSPAYTVPLNDVYLDDISIINGQQITVAENKTKQIGVNVFAADMITSILTKGEFTLSTNDAVNKSGEDYYYTVYGVTVP